MTLEGNGLLIRRTVNGLDVGVMRDGTVLHTLTVRSRLDEGDTVVISGLAVRVLSIGELTPSGVTP